MQRWRATGAFRTRSACPWPRSRSTLRPARRYGSGESEGGDMSEGKAAWVTSWFGLRRMRLRSDLAPVDDIEEGRNVLWAAVLVLEVVGVLPHVDAQDRDQP